MKLNDVIKDLEIKKIFGKTDMEVQDIVYDSKNAVENTVFTALIGMTSDGHRYIKNAYSNGARVFVKTNKMHL